MNIAVVGAGAMGSRFGAELQGAGHAVQLVDPWAAHVEAMCEQGGLIVEDERGPRLVPLGAASPADATGPVDMLLIFGKATQTASLIDAARHLVAEHTAVVTLQNGLGNIEALERVVPRERLVAGVTTIGTELLGPGRIRSLGTGDTYVMQVDGLPNAALHTVVQAFAGSAITVAESADVQTMIWEKVAFNCVLNTLCTLLQCPVSALRLSSRFDGVADAVIDEVALVGSLEGVDVDRARVRATVMGATDPARSGHHLPSMLQDVLNGRRTEIDHLNGEIVRLAAQHGVSAPYSQVITDLVHMAEATRAERVAGLPD